MFVLAAVAVIWGVTFTVVDSGADVMAPADLVAWRFGIATLVLCPIRRRGTGIPALLRRRGIALGALLGSGFLLQAWALTYTDALMSGFLTSLLVVIAPLTAWVLFRERLRAPQWIGVGVATTGVVLLGLQETGFGPGEVITIGSALAWGLHLVLLARWSEPEHAVDLARIQTGTVAVMALLVVALTGAVTGTVPVPAFPADPGTWATVLFLALIATAAAMVGLSWAQGCISATRAAVILTLEPAVAGVTAAALGAELTVSTACGGALLIAAMLIVEISSQRSPDVETLEVEPRRGALLDDIVDGARGVAGP